MSEDKKDSKSYESTILDSFIKFRKYDDNNKWILFLNVCTEFVNLQKENAELKQKLDLSVKALNDINSHQNCGDSFDICREILKKI